MVQLRVLDILKEQNHTKYWLYKQMNLSYQNFNRMVTNQTSSIRFENLDALSRILDCPIGDLKRQIFLNRNLNFIHFYFFLSYQVTRTVSV